MDFLQTQIEWGANRVKMPETEPYNIGRTQ